jgi:hypothetical protein
MPKQKGVSLLGRRPKLYVGQRGGLVQIFVKGYQRQGETVGQFKVHRIVEREIVFAAKREQVEQCFGVIQWLDGDGDGREG